MATQQSSDSNSATWDAVTPDATRVLPVDIAQRDIAQLKANCRIEEVIRHYGVALQPVSGGQRLVGLCPFHEEQRPSFTVYVETQSFACFGCNTAGDVLDFISRYDHLRFGEAVQRLRALHGAATQALVQFSDRPAQAAHRQTAPAIEHPSTAITDATAESLKTSRPLQTVQEAAEGTHLLLLTAATALAAQKLAHVPEALTYLGERGISLSIARKCRLGYADGASLLSYLSGDLALQTRAQELGLINRLRRETLAHRLVIPEVRNGATVQIIGRTLYRDTERGPESKYLLVCASHEKHLLGYGAALERLQAIHAAARGPRLARSATLVPPSPRGRMPIAGILIVEGALDYVVARGWNLPVIPFALLGTAASRRQLGELLDLHARLDPDTPCLLLLDADAPGQEGAERLRQALIAHHVPVHIVPPLPALPQNTLVKDLGELAHLGNVGREHLLASLGSLLGESAALEGGK